MPLTSCPVPISELRSSPRWFPHMLDPHQDLVLLVDRPEADLRAAGFLDDRTLDQRSRRELIAWSDLAAAIPAGSRADAQYIFHIGHVGSTLISRLLGEHPDILALREPAILRTFSEMAGLEGKPESPWSPASLEARLATLGRLLARTFRPHQRSMVKATSFTSELAARIVPAGSRALLVHATPEHYIENILAGDSSRQELHHLAGSRLARLHRRLGESPWNLSEMSPGQRAAMAWACEMTSLAEAEARLPQGATRWCDFDRFLAAPESELVELAAFFGHGLDPAAAGQIARGPLMSRYSKALEYEYSPRLRDEVLAQSRRENGPEIRAGMNWLSRAGTDFPAIAECLRVKG